MRGSSQKGLRAEDEEGEDQHVLDRVNRPRPEETSRLEHRLREDETGDQGQRDPARPAGMAEPMSEPERRRGHPERPLAAYERHGERKRDGAKPQLLLRGVHGGEGDAKWKELDRAQEHVRIRVGRHRQLHAEGNGEQEHGERAQPSPTEPVTRARDSARSVDVSSHEKELPASEPEPESDREHDQCRQAQQRRFGRDDLVLRATIGPRGEACGALEQEQRDEAPAQGSQRRDERSQWSHGSPRPNEPEQQKERAELGDGDPDFAQRTAVQATADSALPDEASTREATTALKMPSPLWRSPAPAGAPSRRTSRPPSCGSRSRR